MSRHQAISDETYLALRPSSAAAGSNLTLAEARSLSDDELSHRLGEALPLIGIEPDKDQKKTAQRRV